MKTSILINNYNYARYLSACIDSALAQDYADVEVVVVDDGSSDGSQDIINAYGDRVVSVLKSNGGQASSFNAGFAAASGNILFLLDADDAFLPGKLRQMAEIYERERLDWCFDRVTTAENAQPPLTPQYSLVDKREMMRKGGFPSLPVPTSGLSFTRATLGQILPMAVARDVVLSDNYLKFAAAFLGRGAVVDTPLTFQRIHGSNRYTGQTKSDQLRSHIMVATGLELSRRFDGLQVTARSLVAGGLARSKLPLPQLWQEIQRCRKEGQLGGSALALAAQVALKSLSQGRSSP